MGVVLFVESEAIETVAEFMTLHLLLKMQRVGTAYSSLASKSGNARLIANYVFLKALNQGKRGT